MPTPRKIPTSGWLEAAIAWEVCASMHQEYCKGKDPFYTTRHADFVGHAEECRREYKREVDREKRLLRQGRIMKD